MFRTQAGRTYAPNTKCFATYKRKSSCPELKFSCSKFDIYNKHPKCKGKDVLQVLANGKKKSYCRRNGPDVTTTGKTLKVSFLSDRRKQSSGAVCTLECVSPVETTVPPPSTEIPGPAKQKTLPWYLGMEPMDLCVETGTEVVFNKTGHNVVQMATQSDYDACTGFLGENPTVGNNINPFIWQADTDGIFYFACGVGTHCSAGGMKAKIAVAKTCIKDVHVPWSFGMDHQAICVETGTNVIFDKTGSSHNVNQLASQSDYDSCSGFTDTAGNSAPYMFSAVTPGVFYFACGVGNGFHCNNGNMKAMVTVADSCA